MREHQMVLMSQNKSVFMRKQLFILVAYFVGLSSFAQTDKGKLFLFSDELKNTYPSVIYDFLERYLYEIRNSQNGYLLNQRMTDDKVNVVQGDVVNVTKLSPMVPFSINKIDNFGYDVCWTDTLGNTLLELQFPVQFELLLGKTKSEIETTVKNSIQSMDSVFSPVTDMQEIEELDSGYFRTTPSFNYYVESLNTSRYYEIVNDTDTVAVFNPRQKWYSVANLFHGIINDTNEYRLYIQQNLYGFKQMHYTITLSQWLNYCKDNNLIVYFAIEEEREDGLKGLLIAQNTDLGYNHMMSIIIPDNFIEKKNATFKVSLNAFIPTDNVKELYQKYTERAKKKIEFVE